MKRIISLLAVAVISVCCSCGGSDSSSSDNSGTKSYDLTIVFKGTFPAGLTSPSKSLCITSLNRWKNDVNVTFANGYESEVVLPAGSYALEDCSSWDFVDQKVPSGYNFAFRIIDVDYGEVVGSSEFMSTDATWGPSPNIFVKVPTTGPQTITVDLSGISYKTSYNDVRNFNFSYYDLSMQNISVSQTAIKAEGFDGE